MSAIPMPGTWHGGFPGSFPSGHAGGPWRPWRGCLKLLCRAHGPARQMRAMGGRVAVKTRANRVLVAIPPRSPSGMNRS